MLGAENIIDFFHANGASFFTFPGGTIAPLYDALLQRGIAVFTARHEQGAGYAALAKSRLLQEPQVVMVTSGPGVTNILSVVADAYFDGTPLIVLTGQVGTADLQSGRPVRQRGFQEVDTPAIVSSVCKHCYQVTDPETLPSVLVDAYALSMSGRRGPVVIDLPMNVQRAEVHCSAAEVPAPTEGQLPHQQVQEAVESLSVSERPVILAGQGVLQSGGLLAFRKLVHQHNIPVVSSLLGLGCMPGDSPLNVGFVGHTGVQVAGQVLQEADFVLVLGARLDVRQTGTCVDDFCRHARKILRVDIDAGELSAPRVRTDGVILGDVKHFLNVLSAALPTPTGLVLNARGQWLARIETWKQQNTTDAHEDLSPKTVVQFLDKVTAGKDVVLTTGVGSHQHWAARHFTFDWPKRVLLTSGGHGTMGYDVPSAVGAALTYPDRTILCIVGDASFQMNIQELQSIRDHNLNIKIIVLDNGRMALVSQFQQLTWGSDPTTGNVLNPDFVAIAQAYGIDAVTVENAEALPGTQDLLLSNKPALLHCRITPHADVLPMLLAGQKLDAMHHGDIQ